VNKTSCRVGGEAMGSKVRGAGGVVCTYQEGLLLLPHCLLGVLVGDGHQVVHGWDA
jgi:hypothetical protein